MARANDNNKRIIEINAMDEPTYEDTQNEWNTMMTIYEEEEEYKV